jgi:hypothetical protein
MYKWVCTLILITFLSACTALQPEPTPTSIPPTETSSPPTPTLAPEPIFFGEVTFDGNECTMEGPEEVSRGRYYFILNNESDINLQIWINQLLEEKTFQDLVDWQEEPGVYLPPPKWIDHPRTMFSEEAGTLVHFLDKIGNYAILIGDSGQSSLWFCEPFSVVEVLAD